MRLLFFLIACGLATAELPAQFDSGPYLSARAGAGGAIDGGLYLGADLSGGYQWGRWVGVGVSLGGYLNFDYYSSDFTGVALQYRVRPGRQWAVTADAGLLLGYGKGTNAAFLEYLPREYSFIRTFLTWHPFGSFNLGLGFVGVPLVHYRVCNDYDAPSLEACTPVYEGTDRWMASGVLFTLGFTLE